MGGGDPDAAWYWLVGMLDGGAEPRYLARRLVRMASEDIGLADPRALRLALGEMSVLLLGGQHLQPQRTQASGFDWRYPRLEPALTALLR